MKCFFCGFFYRVQVVGIIVIIIIRVGNIFWIGCKFYNLYGINKYINFKYVECIYLNFDLIVLIKYFLYGKQKYKRLVI